MLTDHVPHMGEAAPALRGLAHRFEDTGHAGGPVLGGAAHALAVDGVADTDIHDAVTGWQGFAVRLYTASHSHLQSCRGRYAARIVGCGNPAYPG